MHENYVPSEADERRITIEVQTENEIVLKEGGALKGIIIPTMMLESQLIKEFVNYTKCDVRTYDVDVWDPRSSFALLATKARDYISEMTRLKP